MPTIIGSVLILAAIVCFFQRRYDFLSVVFFSSFFEAASITSNGSMSIQPYYFVACLFILRTALDAKLEGKYFKKFKGRLPLVLFAIIGSISAITLPFVFSGTPIYSPHYSSDTDLFVRPPLRFGIGNVAQAVYLIINVLVVIAASQRQHAIRKAREGRPGYRYAFYFFLTLIFVQFAFVVLDIPFPYSFFQTNPGYAMANVTPGALSRVMGTFTESSGAGLVLSALAAATLARVLEGRVSAMRFFVVLAALAIVRSSSAIAAVGLTAGIMLLYYPIIRFPWHVRLYRLWRVSALAAGVSIAVLVLVWSPLRTSLASQTVDKTNSISYFARTTRDLFSLKITLDTHGLGVGLGSNRPSSLLTSLISNVGVAGLLVFLYMYFRVLSNAKGTATWIKWAALALLVDMALATPDINTPFLWALLALVVRLGTSNVNLKNSPSSQRPEVFDQVLASEM